MSYTAVIFKLDEFGSFEIYNPRYQNIDDAFRPYLRVYRIADYKISLTSSHISRLTAFYTLSPLRTRHCYTELIKYTELFSDTAITALGYWPGIDDDSRYQLGFIFKDPKDAAIFKIACEFETTVLDYTGYVSE